MKISRLKRRLRMFRVVEVCNRTTSKLDKVKDKH